MRILILIVAVDRPRVCRWVKEFVGHVEVACIYPASDLGIDRKLLVFQTETITFFKCTKNDLRYRRAQSPH